MELFNGHRVSVLQYQKVLKISWAAMLICLTLVNYTLIKTIKMVNPLYVFPHNEKWEKNI